MEGLTHLLVMALDRQRFALPLASVERVIRAVELTPLPESPPHVLGIVNVQGKIITVISLRRRCRMPERDIEPGDQIVIVNTPRGQAALVVDRAEVVACGGQSPVTSQDVLPGSEFVLGVIKRTDGMILVCEPGALVALPETEARSAGSRQARLLDGLPTARIEHQ